MQGGTSRAVADLRRGDEEEDEEEEEDEDGASLDGGCMDSTTTDVGLIVEKNAGISAPAEERPREVQASGEREEEEEEEEKGDADRKEDDKGTADCDSWDERDIRCRAE